MVSYSVLLSSGSEFLDEVAECIDDAIYGRTVNEYHYDKTNK